MNTRKYSNNLEGKINITGLAIQNRREFLGLSRQDLSDKLMILGIDISSQSIYNIEIGIRTVADYELCAIAEILKTSTDELMKSYRNKLKN